MAIDFKDQVAVVTGAGGGLGKEYALLLAKMGAKVVVNDLGCAMDGSGKARSTADAVVKEIEDAGGEAVANYDGVDSPEGGNSIVRTAIDHFGRIDILINNAGILRDKSFHKMAQESWAQILTVHLSGAFHCSQPAYQYMREQQYGRIVLTTSSAALFGNFGQTNYGAAKLALVGLMNSLRIEGKSRNVLVNAVAPQAVTRMTEKIIPPDLHNLLAPPYVAPVVAYLCSRECKESGSIFNVGGGCVSRSQILTGPVTFLGKEIASVDDVSEKWPEILSMENPKPFDDAAGPVMDFVDKLRSLRG